jgi:nucleoside-diphosphate-sugar epimerase
LTRRYIFLGSGVLTNHYAEYLKGMGHEIIQFSSQIELSDSLAANGDIRNYSNLPNLRLTESDVIYCSWRKLQHESAENLLGLSKGQKVKKIFFLSTSAVYGECKSLVNESSEVHPKSQYALEKLQIENYLLDVFGGRSIILRLGSIFGGSNLPGFIDALTRYLVIGDQKPFSIDTLLSCTRNFLSLGQLSRILYELSDSDFFENSGQEIINIGSEKSISLGDVIHMGEIKAGRNIVVDSSPMHPSQILNNNFSIAKLQSVLFPLRLLPETMIEEFFTSSFASTLK